MVRIKNLGAAAGDASLHIIEAMGSTVTLQQGALQEGGPLASLAPGATATLLFSSALLPGFSASNGSMLLRGPDAAGYDPLDFLRWGAVADDFAYNSAVGAGIWRLNVSLAPAPFFDYRGDGSVGAEMPERFWESPRLRVAAIAFTTQSAALHNFASAPQNLSSWQLCVRRQCAAWTTLAPVGGGAAPQVLQPGQRVEVISPAPLNRSQGEVSLVRAPHPAAQLAAEDMVDFVQFGAAGDAAAGLRELAVASKTWPSRSEFVNVQAVVADRFVLIDDAEGARRGAAQWSSDGLVRVISVSRTNAGLALQHWGATPVNTAAFHVGCGNHTVALSDLALLAGTNFTLSLSNPRIALRLPAESPIIRNASCAMGLFSAGPPLGPDKLLDFVLWGAPSPADEAAQASLDWAVARGFWVRGRALAAGGSFVWQGQDPLTWGADTWAPLETSAAFSAAASQALLPILASAAAAALALLAL
jgi:hypothetical protein